MVAMLKSLRGTLVHRLVRPSYKPPAVGTSGHYMNSLYDRQTVEIMWRVLRRKSNCIDLGAHTGGILRHMLNIAPKGRHHAFEALPHLAVALRAHFPQAVIHEAAAGCKSGVETFNFVENAPAYSGLKQREYDRPDPKIREIQVPIVCVDDVIPRDQRIAFIKADIEGGEYHALQGGAKTILRSRPVIVMEAGRKSATHYGVTASDMHKLLVEELGYRISTMGRWLNKADSLTAEEFAANWENGPEYYFIATPDD